MIGKKKTGPAGTIPADAELAALDDYEAWQRTAFEAGYFDEPEAWLLGRLRDLSDEQATPTRMVALRERRILAERWAIERILKRRSEGWSP